MDRTGRVSRSLSSAGPALQAPVDVLALVSFGDPAKDPFSNWQTRPSVASSPRSRGPSRSKARPASAITVYTHGRIPAKRVVVVGAGPRSDFANPTSAMSRRRSRRLANKVGAATVAFVLPPLGGNREAALVQLAIEGVYLGTYKFARYLTGEDAKRARPR